MHIVHIVHGNNISMNTFPDNKVNHYVTALSNRIEVDGDWEVEMSEIIFPHSWCNVGWKDQVKRGHFPFALSTDLVSDIKRCRSPMMTRGKHFYRLYTG